MTRRRLFSAVALAVGLAAFAWLLHRAGLGEVWMRLVGLGWAAPLVLLPSMAGLVVDTLGWRSTLSPTARARVPLWGLLLARMGGETVNSITPAAPVGEPVKAQLLRRWQVPAAEAFASVVVAKTALVASQSVFTALGISALLLRFGRPGLALVWLAVLLAACVAFTAALIWAQHRGPARASWRLLNRVAPRAQMLGRLEAGATAIDHRLREFYRGRPGAFLRAAGWHFTGWLVGVVEIAVIVTLLGRSVSWLDAFVIETVSQPIRLTSLVIPAGIGSQEVGGVWLCTLLGMGEADAVSLWLLRRARETLVDGAGALYLLQRGGRRVLKAA